MATEDVQGILEGLKLGQARRTAAIQQGLEQQRVQLERERNQQTAKHENEQLDILREAHKQQTAHEAAVLKATQAVHAVQRLSELQTIGQKAEQGAPIPGSQVTGETPDTQTLQLPTTNENGQVPGVIGSVPLPDTVTIRKPAKVAADELTRLEPAERMKARLQQDITDRQIKLEELKATQESKKITQQLEMQRVIGAAHDAARIEAAKLQHAGDTTVSPSSMIDAVQGIADLQYSGADIRRNFPGKGHAEAVFDAATKAGLVIPNDDQKKIPGAFTPAVQALPLYDQLDQVIKQAGGVAGLLIHPQLLTQARNIQNQISEGLTNAAVAIGQTRITDAKIKTMAQAYTPSLLPTADNSTRKAQLQKLLTETIDSRTYGLSSAQATRIKHNLGLETTKIHVRRKSDGNEGMISPQFFDPNKYDKVEAQQ